MMQTYVGTCAQRDRTIFVVELRARGPDGVMKNYGPHCREGQCGAERMPVSQKVIARIKKYGWTDCGPKRIHRSFESDKYGRRTKIRQRKHRFLYSR